MNLLNALTIPRYAWLDWIERSLFVCVVVLGANSPIALVSYAQESTTTDQVNLESLERRIQKTTIDILPSIVSIVSGEGDSRHTGVLVADDGYVLTDASLSGFHTKTEVKVWLSDGRCVLGECLGWSQEWNVGLLKIDAFSGLRFATSRETPVDIGESLLVAGFSPIYRTNQYDSKPDFVLRQVTRTGGRNWFSISLARSNPGNLIFDLEGRLVGLISVPNASGDEVSTTVSVVKTYWDKLKQKTNLDSTRLRTAESTFSNENVQTNLIAPTRDNTTEQLERLIREVTVRIRSAEDPNRPQFSGVIVTSDGYVATCAHHGLGPGERVIISHSDGRTTKGQVLGSNQVVDIGVVKLLGEESFPFVPIGKSVNLLAGEKVHYSGFPGGGDCVVVASHIVAEPDTRESNLIYTSYPPSVLGGMSGGGVFDSNGRLVAVNHGSDHISRNRHGRIEFLQFYWEELVNEKFNPLVAPTKPMSKGIAEPLRRDARFVVDIYRNGKRFRRGCVVQEDGKILTKASGLYGELSVKVSDGHRYPATVLKSSRELDLALLSIPASGFPVPRWSDATQVAPGKITWVAGAQAHFESGMICTFPRNIEQVTGWLGVDLKDVDGGVVVSSTELARHFAVPLQLGDQILKLEGQKVESAKSLYDYLESKENVFCAGDTVHLRVLRNNSEISVAFTLAPTAFSIPVQVAQGNVDNDTASRSVSRSTGFKGVMGIDMASSPQLCGGPVLNSDLDVLGILIAINENPFGDTLEAYIIPASDARKFVLE